MSGPPLSPFLILLPAGLVGKIRMRLLMSATPLFCRFSQLSATAVSFHAVLFHAVLFHAVLFFHGALGSRAYAENPSAVATNPSAVATVAAMEKVLISAIARGEKSVVAIAIFRAGGLADSSAALGRQGFRVNNKNSVPALDAIPDSFATGVVIDRAGLILTNQHILRGKPDKMRIFIRLAGRPVWEEVAVKAADPYSDLAVLELLHPRAQQLKLQPVVLADATKVRKGQIVITLGNPYAIARDGSVSAGWGIVSNVHRRLPPHAYKPAPQAKPTIHHLGTLIQTDAKLNLGTSGGPLLNLQGEMIGLNTSLAALSGYEQSAGYSIAVDPFFKRALKRLSQGREVEYGFLGIGPEELHERERRAGHRGIRVGRVIQGTPAHGLLGFGDVVTRIEEDEIETLSDLMLAISRQTAGARIELAVLRGGREMMLPVTLTKNRVVGDKVVTSRPAAWRGLRVEYPAAMRSLLFATQIPSGCVLVSEVVPNSPAADAGLKLGMQIRRVGRMPVSTPAEFAQAVAGKRGEVRLDIRNATGVDSEFVVLP
jgi:S1-C subfamily serine protease